MIVIFKYFRDIGVYVLLCAVQVFVSKDVALHFGFQSASSAVKGFYSQVKDG